MRGYVRLNRGIIILSAREEDDESRIGKALLFRSAWHAYDCCHATFDNVAMVIIIAADRKSIRYHGRGSVFSQSVTRERCALPRACLLYEIMFFFFLDIHITDPSQCCQVCDMQRLMQFDSRLHFPVRSLSGVTSPTKHTQQISEGEVNARGNNIQCNKVLPVSSVYAREVPHRAREVTR